MNDKRNTQHASPRWTSFAGIALLALASVTAYAGLMRLALGRWGFPLDDAWIHQTYARNLAELGRWVFVPNEPSAGSTSPLWTMLLSLAHILPGNFYLWTYIFGATGLMMVGAGSWQLSKLLFRSRRVALVTVLFCLLEWHLVWAGASGMEITLYSGLIVLLLARYLSSMQSLAQESNPRRNLRPLQWGLLAGLLVMTRPEGVLLGVLIAGHMLLRLVSKPEPDSGQQSGAGLRVADLLIFGVGAVLVIGPYILYNSVLSGTIFPNTFYAKQHEYGILLSTVPLWRRVLTLSAAPWVGAQVLLLPGLVYERTAILRGPRRTARQWTSRALPLTWGMLVILAYALRLPVTYQHGRYVMPVIPVLVVYGLGGTERLLRRLDRPLLRSVLAISGGVLLVAFWGLGSQAYVRDVGIINCEMVATARWLDSNTPPNAPVAAHDIGAIGYFTRRPLVDLAGLVSPEVIPILRDEEALQRLLARRHVPYLVTFSDWYTTLGHASEWEPIHHASCPGAHAAGKEDMVVYRRVQ